MNDRAVSDVLGYILTFGLITLAITVLLMGGLGTLDAVRSTARVDSATRGVAVLESNLEEVIRGGAPIRSTELQLNGGSLRMNGSTQLTVNVTNLNTNTSYQFSRETTPFVFRVAGQAILLDAGARFRRSTGGVVTMESEPPFVISKDRTAVTVVVQRGRGSVDAESTVQAVTHARTSFLVNHSAVAPTATDLEVRFEVNTTAARAAAWKTYFEREGLSAVDADPSDGTVAYKHKTQRVVVRAVIVEFSFR